MPLMVFLDLFAQPEPAQVPSRTSTKRANRVMTAVEHTSKVLMVIGEAAPVASPLKAAGAALERIVELAKVSEFLNRPLLVT